MAKRKIKLLPIYYLIISITVPAIVTAMTQYYLENGYLFKPKMSKKLNITRIRSSFWGGLSK